MLMILLSNSGEMFEGEIKVISLNFLTNLKSVLLIGPIIIFISWDLKSWTAAVSLSLSPTPESLGTINNFLSLISPTAICKEYKSELPNSENSPVRGAIKPTFSFFASSVFAILKLENKIK